MRENTAYFCGYFFMFKKLICGIFAVAGDFKTPFYTRGDKEFWARGYYVETIGNIDEATVKRYIEKQKEESEKGND